MGLRHVLHQREAHASAPPPLSLAPPHPVEFLEDLPLLLRGDPHALVRDRDRELVVREHRVHGDRTTVARVLDRVVDQVGQRLADGVGIHRHLGQVGRHPGLDLEAPLSEGVRERLERVPDQGLDGRGHHVVGPPPALDPREVEHVVDEAGEPLALAGDHPVVLLTPRRVGHPSHLERLAEHPDDRQRRLQIVGHVRDEIGFELGHLGFPAHEPPGEDEAREDDDEERAEGRGKDDNLPSDRLPGRRSGGQVDRHAPAREAFAKGDRQNALGPVE